MALKTKIIVQQILNIDDTTTTASKYPKYTVVLGTSISSITASELTGAVEASAASAAAAKDSEIAAKESETNAKDSENLAAIYANSSETSATQSAASATEAERQASLSKDSADASATSAEESKGFRDSAELAAQNAEQSRLLAEQAKKDAEAAKTAAATSEQNAATSATESTNQATAATGSATKAGEYATAAKDSEIAAKTSELNAKDSEHESAISAGASEASASQSAISATQSAASATKSAESSAAAKTSETNAIESSAAAKTSETNAKTSETNAKTSETNAAAYAAAAKTSETNAADSAASASDSKGFRDEAEAFAAQASTSALAAKNSETSTKTSETNSKASEAAAKLAQQDASDSANIATQAMTTTKSYRDEAEGFKNTATTAATTATEKALEAASSATTAGEKAVAASSSADRAETAAASAEQVTQASLKKDQNLADLTNKELAREALQVETVKRANAGQPGGYSAFQSPTTAYEMRIANDGGWRVVSNIDNGKTMPLLVDYGGTGALNAADARTNLALNRFSQADSSQTYVFSGDGTKKLFIDDAGTWGVWNNSIDVPIALPIYSGGTGAVNINDARANLGIGLFGNDTQFTTMTDPSNKYQVFVRDTGDWGCVSPGSSRAALPIISGGTGATDAAGAARSLKVMGDGLPDNRLDAPYLSSGVYYAGDDSYVGGSGKPFNYTQILNLAEQNGNVGNWTQLGFSILSNTAPVIRRRNAYPALLSDWSTFVVKGLNATIDTNGFYKSASPIVKLKGDGSIETNSESEGATSSRLEKGVYIISGVLGFNSNPEWGGVDGGFVIPTNNNGLPLLWVDYEISAQGDILIKTYHRVHENVPPFAKNTIQGVNNGDPIDIPSGRWIDLRVEMPADSIYNKAMEEARTPYEKAEKERLDLEEK
ncbi:lateral tail fiber protein [Escherichia phage TrudiRoth]|uniref:Lateral tail fiber protein n=1 Tax=Escherichia phage TrudiRoth TaxID=2851994 RepID=A0AAE7VZX5_9CAUD|nr:lateral tail fiber protein [Escherichia phage TrudiRoth]